MKIPVAAIDFGTSKIVTLVAENSNLQRCDIVGAGIAPYDGYLEDGWNNPGELDDAIQKAIRQASEQSHRKVTELNVGVPGAFTRVYATEATIELSGADPRVSAADVRRVFQEARRKLEQIPGVVIHSTPAWFMGDDGKKTLEPAGQKTRTLRGMISFVAANQFFVDDLTVRLANLGFSAVRFFSTSAGEAMLYLPEVDRDRTAVLIDIGYLNTEVMVAEGDALIYHDTIELGGGNIAADLAMGLDIPLDAAEQIKRQYVYGIAQENATYDVAGAGGAKPLSFPRDKVQEVLEPRVDEIAELIRHSIDESGVKLGNWSNLYLTGGGLAFNRGGREYLAGKLGRPIRDTPKRTTKLNSHVFSSSLGLMDLIIDTMEQQKQPQRGGALRNLFRDLLGI